MLARIHQKHIGLALSLWEEEEEEGDDDDDADDADDFISLQI